MSTTVTIAWIGKVIAKTSHGRLSSFSNIGGALMSTPGTSPTSVVGRPKKRIRSEAPVRVHPRGRARVRGPSPR